MAVAIFFIGTRMRALGNIIHECAHGTFVSSYKANIFIGTCLSIMEFSDFQTYRKEHFAHHRYLGDVSRDPDFLQRVKIGIYEKDVFKIKNFILCVFSPYHWYLLLKSSFLMPFNNTKEVILRGTYFLLLIIFCIFIGIKCFLLFIVLPYLTTYQMMKIFSDLYDHGEIYYTKTMKNKTRNHFFSWKILNLIFFPRNDAFHLVHHLYPSVPSCELENVHHFLMEKDDWYKEKKHYII